MYAFSQSNLLTLLIRKRVSLLFLSDHTLADLDFSQGGILSTDRAILDRLGPPRDAKIVMCAMREDDVSPWWRYASKDVNLYIRNSAHGHQPKGGQSCADGARSTRDNTHGMCQHVSGHQHSGRRSQ